MFKGIGAALAVNCIVAGHTGPARAVAREGETIVFERCLSFSENGVHGEAGALQNVAKLCDVFVVEVRNTAAFLNNIEVGRA